MKKINFFLIVIIILNILLFSGCVTQNESSNDNTPPNNNPSSNPPEIPSEPTKYTVDIRLSTTITSSQYLQVDYRVYDNVQNWKYVDPIIDTTKNGKTIIFDSKNLFTGQTFTVPVDKTYMFQIWFACECVNCGDCYITVPNMLDELRPLENPNPVNSFYGTFSSDETFNIHTTGYVTKSDGSLLTRLNQPQ